MSRACSPIWTTALLPSLLNELTAGSRVVTSVTDGNAAMHCEVFAYFRKSRREAQPIAIKVFLSEILRVRHVNDETVNFALAILR